MVGSSREVARINTTDQVKALEKVLGIDFPTEAQRKSAGEITEEDLIGGRIVEETFTFDIGEDRCIASSETYFTIETNRVRNTDEYYDYYDWREIMIDPPNAPLAFETELIQKDKAAPEQGVSEFPLYRCEPAGKDSGTPCEGGGIVEFIPNSENVAEQFQKLFGRCQGHYPESMNKIRRMFGIRECGPWC